MTLFRKAPFRSLISLKTAWQKRWPRIFAEDRSMVDFSEHLRPAPCLIFDTSIPAQVAGKTAFLPVNPKLKCPLSV